MAFDQKLNDTELLAHRDKIEVTRSGAPFERSPVPMARAHLPYARSLRASPENASKLRLVGGFCSESGDVEHATKLWSSNLLSWVGGQHPS